MCALRRLPGRMLALLVALLAACAPLARQPVAPMAVPIEDPARRLRKLSDLLLESPEYALEYHGEITLAARELFARRAGNCLSFTISPALTASSSAA